MKLSLLADNKWKAGLVLLTVSLPHASRQWVALLLGCSRGGREVEFPWTT